MWNVIEDVSRVTKRGQWLLIALLCCSAVQVAAGSVAFASDRQGASGQPRFSLAPAYYDPGNLASLAYFVLNTRQGALVHNALRLTNVGNQTGTVSLLPADASTAQATGIVYSISDPAQHAVGSWLSLSKKQVTLAAGQSQLVTFTVHVPAGETPGQFVGGIIAQSAAEPTSSGANAAGNIQFHVSLVHQQIIAVHVNVQGTLTQQLAASGLQASVINGNQAMLIDLHNSGNTMISPSGTLQIINAAGKTLQTLPLHLDIMLPGASITYPALLQGQPLATGSYRAVLTMTYGQKRTLTYSTSVSMARQDTQNSISPPPPTSSSNVLLIVALALLAVFAAGGLLISKRLRVASPSSRLSRATRKPTRKQR